MLTHHQFTDMSSSAFRFTDLPPEVRNMIYRLAATFSSPSSYWGKRDYSNLFQISKPIRNESIAFFYQQRTFTVFLQDTKRWAPIFAWLDKTSPIATCKTTRNFIIRGDLSTTDIADMELFHSKLSDEARVVYCFWRTCREVEPVEEIRDAYAGMELGRVPVITYRVTGATLTFPPRMGWFGGKDGAAGAEAP